VAVPVPLERVWVLTGTGPGTAKNTRGLPVSITTDSRGFDRINGQTIVADNDTKKFDSRLLEFTFLWFQVEVVILEDLKDLARDPTMFFNRFGEDNDVIHVHKDFPSLHEGRKIFFIIVWNVAGEFVIVYFT